MEKPPFIDNNNWFLLFLASIPLIAYFLKQKDHRLENMPSVRDLEHVKSEANSMIKEWASEQIRNLEEDWKNSLKEAKAELKMDIQEVKRDIKEFKESVDHKIVNKLNNHNMEGLLAFDRLEKTDRVIEENNILLKRFLAKIK